jgi:TrmH family RNA methyltransferase
MLSKNQIKLIKSLESKKFRKREGLFVAEGPKVVGDLLRAGYQPHAIYATPQCSMVNGQWSTVTDDELHRISFLQHPQEILAVFHIPTPQESSNLHLPSDICLALDGVQDPGNVGTIIRIADWFGITHIYCSPDTADVYNPKVVQATMGSLAHVQITYCDLVPLLREAAVPVYGTLLDGQDIYQQPLSREGVIVMGNEGNGISPEVRQLVSHKLLIPNFNKNAETAESLNVAIATSITCSEFRRRF